MFLYMRTNSFDSDAWFTFMNNEGYNFSPSKQLTVDQFVLYRKRMEALQPIAPELRLLGLKYLPDYLIHWSKSKLLIQEVLSLREFLKSTNRDEAEKLQGFITVIFMKSVILTFFA